MGEGRVGVRSPPARPGSRRPPLPNSSHRGEGLCCAAHRRCPALVQIARALLGPPRQERMRMVSGLASAPGEMADTTREPPRRFAADRIAPLAARIDEEDWFPRELWPEMGALGLHGVTVEEEYGGL